MFIQLGREIVFNKSKIQNERKSQLETLNGFILLIVFNKSKIQNERKSQPYLVMPLVLVNCVQQVKDTKWKEITTQSAWIFRLPLLCSTSQRYKMKGNHNSISPVPVKSQLCSTSQRYKMKGNHNEIYYADFLYQIVFNKSKIQNERKSQLLTRLM